MFLKDRKLDRRISELKQYRYRDAQTIQSFLSKEDEEKLVNPKVPTDYTGWGELKLGDYWSGRDRYLWMHKEIQIPESFQGKRVVGVFDFGKTGAGNNCGFEAMCYINEKPYQGVDLNHQEVFFHEEDMKKTDFTYLPSLVRSGRGRCSKRAGASHYGSKDRMAG